MIVLYSYSMIPLFYFFIAFEYCTALYYILSPIYLVTEVLYFYICVVFFELWVIDQKSMVIYINYIIYDQN